MAERHVDGGHLGNSGIMAFLSWLGQTAREERPLRERTRIGWFPANDIVLADPMVSWFHAQVVFSNGNSVLEDKNSANGCCVNGERRSRSILRDGDGTRIGSVEMCFRLPASAPDSAVLADAGAAPAPPGSAERSSAPIRIVDFEGLLRDDRGGTRITTVTSVVAPPYKPEGAEDPRTLSRKLRASYEISQATAATLDLPRVLDRILAAVFDILEAAERSFILLRNPATAEIWAISSAASRRPTSRSRLIRCASARS